MIPSYLTRNPFPDTEWPEEMKPILILDGIAYSIDKVETKLIGKIGYVIGTNQKSFDKLCDVLSVKILQFYEMRVPDIKKLSLIEGLKELAINWNTKIVNISSISELESLMSLVLVDTPKIRNLEPIANLKYLEILEYSGGIWNKNNANNLNPISKLRNLKKLRISNLKVDSNGLKPLGSLSNLRELEVSNQFPTEDYAYLTVKLKQTKCSHFQPFIKLGNMINGKDIMVVGTRKPFLNSSTDGSKLQLYEKNFEELCQKFI